MEKYEVILVDDEKSYLELLSEVIQDFGKFNTVVFDSPDLALEYIKKNSQRIALIVSDFNMPDVNGFQFRKNMLPKYGEIPFIIMTGFWNKNQAEEAMEYKIQSFLDKNLDEKMIEENVNKFADPRCEMLTEQTEMIQGFIEESYSMLDDIENLILKLEEDDNKEETLQIYFRLLHTIKGTAACVGLPGLADYSHKYEDFISSIRNGVFTINNSSMNLLLGGLDKLKFIFDHIVEKGHDDVDITNDIQKFLGYKEGGSDTAQIQSQESNSNEDEGEKKVSIEVKKDKKEEKTVVSMEILDNFLEESGELTVLRNAIVKTVKNLEDKYKGDRELDTLNDLLEGMQIITGSIQSSISFLRKVPIKTVFRPYKRLVRDLARNLGKDIVLETSGDELLIDSRLAKLFSNTLIHLIRNAIDHGIEGMEERAESGKNTKGVISIDATEINERIMISITDDGRGMSLDKLKEKAIEKEIYSSEELDAMSNSEIYGIIFNSGFSTAKEVTDVSGRGVGMDMVMSSVVERGGEIVVDSELGEGSTFTLEVPIPKSVFIINSLLVKNNEQTYVVPVDHVLEILKVEKSNAQKIVKIENEVFLQHQNSLFDIVSLSKGLGCEISSKDELDLIIIRSKLGNFALNIDEVIGFEEVVVRKINKNIVNNDYYKGASLLGDNDIALILDMDRIAEVNELSAENIQKETAINKDPVDFGVEYMQFKLDSSQNFAIGLANVYRLEKIKLDAVNYTGDMAIVRYFDSIMPLINIDNKLGQSENLHSHIKKDRDFLDVIVVRQNQRFFGLAVNSISDIGLSESEFYTDMANTSGIMGSTYINGSNITILDVTYLTSSFFKKEQDEESETNPKGHRSTIDRMKLAA